MTDVPIRDAATVVVLRDLGGTPNVLMGQRGKSAAFMPNKFVFPGGALDAEDAQVPLAQPLHDTCLRRLRDRSDHDKANALAAAAVRELWEEAGLALGATATAPDGLPADWRSFFDLGLGPSGDGMRFIFRAITPPGRPRRFDARFFLVDADRLAGDPDDFTHAQEELSHLQWIPLSQARDYDLPFITEVVLAEVENRIDSADDDLPVPFFYHQDGRSHFLRID